MIGKVLDRGKVEELYVASAGAGTGVMDVWFRNATQNTALGVGSDPHLNGLEPLGVAWSVDGLRFAVWTAGYHYHVFRLNRERDEELRATAVAAWERSEDPFASELVGIDAVASVEAHGTATWWEAVATRYGGVDSGGSTCGGIEYSVTRQARSIDASLSSRRTYTMRQLFYTDPPDVIGIVRTDDQAVLYVVYWTDETHETTDVVYVNIRDTWLDAAGALYFTLHLSVDISLASSAGAVPRLDCVAGAVVESSDPYSADMLVLEEHVGVWNGTRGWLWKSHRIPGTLAATFNPSRIGADSFTYSPYLGGAAVVEMGGGTVFTCPDAPPDVTISYTTACAAFSEGWDASSPPNPGPRIVDSFVDATPAPLGDTGFTSSDHVGIGGGIGFLRDETAIPFIEEALGRLGLGPGLWLPQDTADLWGWGPSYRPVNIRNEYTVQYSMAPQRDHYILLNYADMRDLRLVHWDSDPTQARYLASVWLSIDNDYGGSLPLVGLMGVFVIDGRGHLIQVIKQFDVGPVDNLAPVMWGVAPQLLGASDKHVLYVRSLLRSYYDFRAYHELVVTELATGKESVVATSNPDPVPLVDAFDHSFRIMEPGRLYAFTDLGFVTGWDAAGTPTLKQASPRFPPLVGVLNSDLQPAGGITKLTLAVVPTTGSGPFDFSLLPSYYCLVAEGEDGVLHPSEVVMAPVGAGTGSASGIGLTWTNPAPAPQRIWVFRSNDAEHFDAWAVVALLPGSATEFVDVGVTVGSPPAPTSFQAGARLPARRLVQGEGLLP